jgi:predicted nuclease of predicted toxin-antitoxin system
VLKIAKDEDRILITFDSDYGELVYFAGYAAPLGIIYLRINPKTPEEPAELIKSLIAVDESILVGSFLVLERDSIRRRMIPESA